MGVRLCYHFRTLSNKPGKKITVSDSRTRSPDEGTRSRAGIRNAAGSWQDIDTEAFTAYSTNRRQTATRPRSGGDL
jgi:hypothetical protein